MNLHLKGLLYRILIDPLLNSLRVAIVEKSDLSDSVIDIACGTGTLALAIAGKTNFVTGIDLDEELISYALARASEKRVANVRFDVRDASDLSVYSDKEFGIAVTSMAVHQFEPQLAVKVLSEMKRVARKVIIADYNYPLETGFSGMAARSIEKMAGGDHYRNFRNYMSVGGISHFTDAAGIEIKSTVTRGNGVFVVVECV